MSGTKPVAEFLGVCLYLSLFIGHALPEQNTRILKRVVFVKSVGIDVRDSLFNLCQSSIS